MSRRLITAIEIDGAGGHPAAWRGAELDPAAILTGEVALRAVQRAEAAGIDFATFVDTLEAPADEPAQVSARLDALGLAARIAPSTDRIGLIPTLTVTHTEPFHVQASVATLDFVSAGRAGWLADVSTSAEAAAVIGRREPAPAADTWREARYVVDVSRRLWDSWEDDAIIRDAPSGRFIDRDRIHYVDYTSPAFDIKGPSIVPRPPQGHPLTAVRLSSPEALQAAADADLVLLPGATELDDRLAAVRAASLTPRVLLSVSVLLDEDEASGVRRAAGAEVDYVGTVEGLADLIEGWNAAGVDGIHLRPASLELDVPVIAERLVPLLRERRLLGPAVDRATSLRNRLGLKRPANRYVGSRR
ncbi:LLM class flavin-dependent oxidoreductase [Streptomyces sp. SID13031]|uniref:LLM class flavin-dependent oxidoreductase n=1 Tax=Streptomyces sp. SID13031 TaxID=2706046 RepID=UPI0013CC8970|nr:LLM class flavin-dependent oxidoreductase [Streptomyces sp. SID13031]NEA33989.1 LLM class flavin-dependent oxidoreductase [Streptomyces sp. SID13031]